MSVIILLFAAGILMLALEVVVPGAVLGIIGGVCMLVGVVVAFSEYGFGGGTTAAVAGVVLVGIALYLEFVLLPKSRLAKKLTMGGTVAGISQPPIADRAAVVGREAVAVTSLVPSGYVEFNGRRYEAFSRSGAAARGERLDIVDVDNFRLIVSKPLASTLEKNK
jgi:membrane-bound ClpP family serine protease